jgi:DNA-binding MarR family transcriptional regulator
MQRKAQNGLAAKAAVRKSKTKRTPALKREQAVALRAMMALYREFEQVARRSDISMAQYRTLLFLMHGARRAGEISAAAAVTKPTVSLLLNSLRARGWIENVADDNDGRSSLVLITPAGAQRIQRFEIELAEAVFPMAEGIDATAFYEALKHIYKALGDAKGGWLSKIESEELE